MAEPEAGHLNGQRLNSYNRNSCFRMILVPFPLLPVLSPVVLFWKKAILEEYGFMPRCAPAR